MSRRVQCLEVSFTVLTRLFSDHSMEELTTNMPADAKIVGVDVEYALDKLRLYLSSKTFDEVPDGNIVPPFPFEATRHITLVGELLRQFEEKKG